MVALVVAICGIGQPRQSAAQATPTADDVCAPYLIDGTPVAASGTPAVVDVTTLEFDVLFLDAMIPHHEVAVEMALVARDRAGRPEIVELAETIIATQQAEVETMGEWRQAWYPDVPPLSQQQLIDGMTVQLSESPGVGGVAGLEEMGGEHMLADLAQLCATTADFDLAFIDLMLAHHSSAIVLSLEAANRAVHRETRELSSSIASTQQLEVDQLLTWRELWYPDAPIQEHDH
jgi:uncharacterized protein (DUF305 family)